MGHDTQQGQGSPGQRVEHAGQPGGALGPAAALFRLVNGYQVTQAIHAAVVLGIPDALRDAGRTADDLASATGTHARSLYRLLRALAAVGVLREGPGERFSLTPMGECLLPDAPETVGAWAAFVGGRAHWTTWGNLLYSVRTGKSAFEHVHGTDVWSYRARHPEENATFVAAMASVSSLAAASVATTYDFSRFGVVVDVGGGTGTLLAAILARTPGLRGILFDEPHVVSGAPAVLRTAGVEDRCQVVGGSFFERVPPGGDAYILKSIIHDWNDEKSMAILHVCREAMQPAARLLLVERLVGAPNEDPQPKFSDLNMLTSPGGTERTREEFAALYDAAGFRLIDVHPTPGTVSIIEGIPQ